MSSSQVSFFNTREKVNHVSLGAFPASVTLAPQWYNVGKTNIEWLQCRWVLVRLCHRQLVFCPRYEAYEESIGLSTEGPCSFPVAFEDSASAERSGGLTEPRGSDRSSTAGGQLERADRASMADEAAEEGTHLVARSGADGGQGRHADGDGASNETSGEGAPLLAQSSSSPDQVSLQAGALLARSHQQQVAVAASKDRADQEGFSSSSAPREQQDSSIASAHQPQQTSGEQRTGHSRHSSPLLQLLLMLAAPQQLWSPHRARRQPLCRNPAHPGPAQLLTQPCRADASAAAWAPRQSAQSSRRMQALAAVAQQNAGPGHWRSCPSPRSGRGWHHHGTGFSPSCRAETCPFWTGALHRWRQLVRCSSPASRTASCTSCCCARRLASLM